MTLEAFLWGLIRAINLLVVVGWAALIGLMVWDRCGKKGGERPSGLQPGTPQPIVAAGGPAPILRGH